jgi:hypothetical protein
LLPLQRQLIQALGLLESLTSLRRKLGNPVPSRCSNGLCNLAEPRCPLSKLQICDYFFGFLVIPASLCCSAFPSASTCQSLVLVTHTIGSRLGGMITNVSTPCSFVSLSYLRPSRACFWMNRDSLQTSSGLLLQPKKVRAILSQN